MILSTYSLPCRVASFFSGDIMQKTELPTSKVDKPTNEVDKPELEDGKGISYERKSLFINVHREFPDKESKRTHWDNTVIATSKDTVHKAVTRLLGIWDKDRSPNKERSQENFIQWLLVNCTEFLGDAIRILKGETSDINLPYTPGIPPELQGNNQRIAFRTIIGASRGPGQISKEMLKNLQLLNTGDLRKDDFRD